MSEKVTFIKQLRNDASSLAVLFRNVSDRAPLYFDRGYNPSGGADPITDLDAQAAGLSSTSEVDAMITLLQQIDNFLGNSAVSTGDYSATLNNMRDDLTGTSGS